MLCWQELWLLPTRDAESEGMCILEGFGAQGSQVRAAASLRIWTQRQEPQNLPGHSFQQRKGKVDHLRKSQLYGNLMESSELGFI